MDFAFVDHVSIGGFTVHSSMYDESTGYSFVFSTIQMFFIRLTQKLDAFSSPSRFQNYSTHAGRRKKPSMYDYY